MTQNIQRALPGLEGIAPPEKIPKLFDKIVNGVCRGEAAGGGIDEGEIPLARGADEKIAREHELTLKILIGVMITHKKLKKFEFEDRELTRSPGELKR